MLGNAGCTGGAEKLAVAWGVGYRNVHSETDFEARALRYVYGEWRDLERAIRSVMRENGAVIWAGACVGQHVSRCEDVSGSALGAARGAPPAPRGTSLVGTLGFAIGFAIGFAYFVA